MDRERTADDLRDYAAARRLLAVWQALFVGLLVQLATGVWFLALAVAVLGFVGAWFVWRPGGWSYERAKKIWARDPGVRKRDLKLMRPLVGLARRLRRS